MVYVFQYGIKKKKELPILLEFKIVTVFLQRIKKHE